MSTQAPSAPAQPTNVTGRPAMANAPTAAGRTAVPSQAGPAYPGMSAAAAVRAIPQQLRRPTAGDRVPRLRQIIGICGWAAVLGGIGLVIGIRGFIGILADSAAAWYEPALAITGALGILLTVTSFLTAHRRRVPWTLLGMASVVLAVSMGMTIAAF